MGYSPWGHKELDMSEGTEHARICFFVFLFVLAVSRNIQSVWDIHTFKKTK